MFEWMAGHIAVILICVALAVIVAMIILSLVRDKKKGKSSCGCNCAHCAMAGSCHNQGKKSTPLRKKLKNTKVKKAPATAGAFFGISLF